MLAQDIKKVIDEELLPFVSSPSQYIGSEMNIIRKDWGECDVRLALCFPDVYSVGSSSLAMQIIYGLLNRMEGVLCERVYCPWPDAADRMRSLSLPLYTLESYRPIKDFDILAFSVPYEMLYSNIIEILDLGKINIFSAERKANEPLIMIGGSQVHNLEPIADFVDVAIIGEAEATLEDFINEYRKLKRTEKSRDDKLKILAKNFEWVYVPRLYEQKYNSDGTINSIDPVETGIPKLIRKAYVKDLDSAYYPSCPIVPFNKPVHERINIEIMRGCPNSCRFCHEGYTRRPVRVRSREKIIELAKESAANTGMTEISLSSLSSADYPELEELFRELNEIFADKHISIALPSLRIDKQLRLIPSQMGRVRKSPMTIAVEAGTERLRKIIRKNIDLSNLKPAVLEAYRLGWRRVKLYFMVGLPSEKEEDLRSIARLADDISQWRKEVANGAAEVVASISFFVPKSHTPLQWTGQKTLEYYEYAKGIILEQGRRYSRKVRFNFHNGKRSRLEACFARGDRRLGRVIYDAWRKGARLDGWDETFRYEYYVQAFEENGLDMSFYANRDIGLEETLPWEHILAGLEKSRLIAQRPVTD